MCSRHTIARQIVYYGRQIICLDKQVFDQALGQAMKRSARVIIPGYQKAACISRCNVVAWFEAGVTGVMTASHFAED